jgi:CHRD domain/PEP-CTERM motif
MPNVARLGIHLTFLYFKDFTMRIILRGVALLLVALAMPGVSQAEYLRYGALLSGPAEFPANASPGTGYAFVEFDNVAHTLHVNVTFSGLIAGVTAAHIHGPVDRNAAVPTAGVATTVPTFTGFPSGVTFGSYDRTFDTTLTGSFRAAFITANGGTAAGAEAALFNAMKNGLTYLNIHTSQFPGGEIRGFLDPVPEPSSIALLGTGACTLLVFGWKRRRTAA